MENRTSQLPRAWVLGLARVMRREENERIRLITVNVQYQVDSGGAGQDP